MKIQKLTVIILVGMIFLSFSGLATSEKTSQIFEEDGYQFLDDYETEDIVPEWIKDGELPLVPAIIISSGILLFIIFVLALYRKNRRTY